MIIKGAKVFTLDNGFVDKELYVDGKIFADAKSSGDREVIDGEGLFAIPGLIDLHFHGAMGSDFTDGTNEALEKICAYEASRGVVALCPATLTLPVQRLAEIVTTAKNFRPDDKSSDLVGVHLEGPFMSLEKIGAQNPAYVISADMEVLDQLIDASQGLAKIISLAPETNGALDFIKTASKKICCSVAHTTANYEVADTAFKNGATHVTHLYNAMPPFSHREPAVVGAAFDNKNVTVELIADGVHIHPAVVRATFEMFGEDRVVLISDSLMGVGLGDGNYLLGELEVTLKDGKATLANGTIAGSGADLMYCFRNAVTNMGIDLHTAVKAASINPAKVLGVDDKYGSLDTGKYASFVLLNKDLSINKVFIRGKEIEPIY